MKAVGAVPTFSACVSAASERVSGQEYDPNEPTQHLMAQMAPLLVELHIPFKGNKLACSDAAGPTTTQFPTQLREDERKYHTTRADLIYDLYEDRRICRFCRLRQRVEDC